MGSTRAISIVYWVAGLYDGVLGLLFLLFGMSLMESLQITPPNHVGYLQFPAALLIVFALIFFEIARDPIARRGLIKYGVMLKVAYCAVVFWHWMISGLPWIWKPFAIADAVWIVIFVWTLSDLNKRAAAAPAAP